jgi:hypothetical protein
VVTGRGGPRAARGRRVRQGLRATGVRRGRSPAAAAERRPHPSAAGPSRLWPGSVQRPYQSDGRSRASRGARRCFPGPRRRFRVGPTDVA